MLLTINHSTTYHYDAPVPYGLQRLRLTPENSTTQRVVRWETEVQGGTKQVGYRDHYGNHIELVRVDPATSTLQISASGEVETFGTAGVVGAHSGYAPLWIYRRSTPLTTSGQGIRALLVDLEALIGEREAPVDDVTRCHTLMSMVADRVVYESGRTDTSDGAEQVLAVGHGVCQDHAHVFVAAARELGHPARYVSGYLMMNDRIEQEASHAWAEAWIEPLGWVGFDPSNGISPDERYVRLATGLDFEEASPISGLRFGAANESLEVVVHVEQ